MQINPATKQSYISSLKNIMPSAKALAIACLIIGIVTMVIGGVGLGKTPWQGFKAGYAGIVIGVGGAIALVAAFVLGIQHQAKTEYFIKDGIIHFKKGTTFVADTGNLETIKMMCGRRPFLNHLFNQHTQNIKAI